MSNDNLFIDFWKQNYSREFTFCVHIDAVKLDLVLHPTGDNKFKSIFVSVDLNFTSYKTHENTLYWQTMIAPRRHDISVMKTQNHTNILSIIHWTGKETPHSKVCDFFSTVWFFSKLKYFVSLPIVLSLKKCDYTAKLMTLLDFMDFKLTNMSWISRYTFLYLCSLS